MEEFPTQNDQTTPEEMLGAEAYTPEAVLSPERKRAIIETVNNELAEEMRQLHSDEAFHNEGHIEDVEGDAMAILAIFKKYGLAGEDDETAVRAGTRGHDLTINHDVAQDKAAFNYGQRIRHRGFGEKMPDVVKSLGVKKGNEELSWEETRRIITKYDPDKKVYTDAVLEKTRLCIAATYPDAYAATFPEDATTIVNPGNGEQTDLSPYLGKDKDGKPTAFKFDQPFLLSEPESGPSTLSVAFGDLMYGGKCTPEDFIRHGNDEYQETREMIMADIRGGVDVLAPERKAEIAKDMISWIGTQVGFLLWQKVRFGDTLKAFRPINESPQADELKRDLSDLYSKFDQNLIAAKNRMEISAKFESLKDPKTFADNPEAAQVLFVDLLKEMGVAQEKMVY